MAKKKVVKKSARSSVSGDLEGLGGWLILISLSFVFSIASYFLMIIFEGYSSGYLIFTMNVVMFFFSIFVARLYFYKKKKAVSWIIAWLWIYYIVSFLNNYIAGESGLSEIFIYLIGTIIWTLYFVKSIRVKNTFVNK